MSYFSYMEHGDNHRGEIASETTNFLWVQSGVFLCPIKLQDYLITISFERVNLYRSFFHVFSPNKEGNT